MEESKPLGSLWCDRCFRKLQIQCSDRICLLRPDLIRFIILFQAYGSGCDVVILASDFECVQIIPGAQNGNIQVGCVECSHQLGRVSVDDKLRHTPTLNSFWFARLDGVIVYPVHKVDLALPLLPSCTAHAFLFAILLLHSLPAPSPMGMAVL